MAFTEKIGTLTKTSTTQVQLTGTSIVKLGGQQRVLSSPTLLTSVSGLFSSIPNAHAESSTRTNTFNANATLSTTNWTFESRNNAGTILTSTTDNQLTCHKTGIDAIQPDWN